MCTARDSSINQMRPKGSKCNAWVRQALSHLISTETVTVAAVLTKWLFLVVDMLCTINLVQNCVLMKHLLIQCHRLQWEAI